MSRPEGAATGKGFMELRFALEPPKPEFTQRVLLEAAEGAAIHTFGWPIGVVLHSDDDRPRPTTDGIVAEVTGPDGSYDFWSLRANGDFYLLKSLFEDEQRPNSIFVDTRVVRVTESLLYCARLYSRLEVDRSTQVHVAVRHGGLAGRHLTAANPMRRFTIRDRVIAETEADAQICYTLALLEDGLMAAVKQVCAPLFMLFDFFELSDDVYKDLVDGFVAGQVR